MAAKKIKVGNVPNLRFPGFKGEWVEKRLGDVANIARGKSKHRPRGAGFLYGGQYPFIQTGDVKEAGLFLNSYTQTYSNAGLKQSKLWDENTLCITIAANIAETTILKIKACFPDSIIGLVPYKDEASVLFIKHQFDKFKVDVQRLSQGVAQANLNQEKLSDIQFSFPLLIEQEKIASLLSIIDNRIETQSKIIQRLESSIRNFREKLFSQTYRFKDTKGNDFPDWEIKKLADVAMKKSSNISANKIEENVGEYIIYGASGILKSVDFYEEEDNYISIVKDGAGVGRLYYCEGKSSVLGTLEIIKPVSGISTYFLFCLLRTFDFTKYITGSTIPHIYFKDYKNEALGIPCGGEQTKIANFLFAIEQKVKIEKNILKKFENQKQHLLANLFI
jgi:type I restriction enzyme S subunit